MNSSFTEIFVSFVFPSDLHSDLKISYHVCEALNASWDALGEKCRLIFNREDNKITDDYSSSLIAGNELVRSLPEIKIVFVHKKFSETLRDHAFCRGDLKSCNSQISSTEKSWTVFLFREFN